MNNQVVVHFADGKIMKGNTGDFFPNKNVFHLQENGGGMVQVNVSELKAIYFVESLEGDPQFNEKTDLERTGCGRKIKVQFRDGEIQFGYTQGYAPNRPGFFVTPSDADSNNERIFVVTAAAEKVEFV